MLFNFHSIFFVIRIYGKPQTLYKILKYLFKQQVGLNKKKRKKDIYETFCIFQKMLKKIVKKNNNKINHTNKAMIINIYTTSC